MPKIYLWRSAPKKFEHVSMETDKYYISFWPAVLTQTEDPLLRSRIAWYRNVGASIVFSREFDILLQSNNPPDEEFTIRNVTDKAINQWYEKFLRYNGIDHWKVSRSDARRVLRKEWTKLRRSPTDTEGQLQYFGKTLAMEVAYTEYSLYGHLIWHKPSNKYYWRKYGLGPFYQYPQSSATFLYNLIETADINYPDLPIKINQELYRSSSKNYMCLLTVDKFKQICEEHYLRVRIPPAVPNTWSNYIGSFFW